MSNVKWDIKEIMSEHNTYVDMLLRVSKQLPGVSKEVLRFDL